MKRHYAIVASLLALGSILCAGAAHAAVGDPLAVVTVPVPSTLPAGNPVGVSIAADCEGNLYYTNYQTPKLFKMTSAGVLIGTAPLADATWAPVTMGEMAWDSRRNILWGGTDSVNPIKIYQIDPVTGLCTYQFDGGPGIDLTDGLAFEQSASGDPNDDLIYHSPDISTDVYVFQATTGALVRVFTPKDPSGNPITLLSGLTVGTGSQIYVGNNGLGKIYRVDKLTGAFLGVFATPGGRDEGLECDAVNFSPRLALWSKDAYNNTVTAIEVEYGTCNCGGVVPAKPATWGQVKASYR